VICEKQITIRFPSLTAGQFERKVVWGEREKDGERCRATERARERGDGEIERDRERRKTREVRREKREERRDREDVSETKRARARRKGGREEEEEERQQERSIKGGGMLPLWAPYWKLRTSQGVQSWSSPGSCLPLPPV
jgi:hypothetical protein